MRAIHDLHYATPPKDWEDYRWRLQVIAELGVGRAMRKHQAAEDAAFARAADALT